MRLLVITQDIAADRDEVIVGGALKNPFYLVCELRRRGHHISLLSFDRFSHRRDARSDMPLLRYRSWLKLAPKTLWLNARSALTALRAARDADIIQSHHPHFALQVALLKRLGLIKAPLIVKAHGTAFPELHANRWGGVRGLLLRGNARVHLHLDRFVLDVADRTISSSAFQAQEMTELYSVPKMRVTTIYNGYPREAYEHLPVRAAGEQHRLLFVGRIVPKKGVDYFIELVRSLAQRLELTATLVLGHANTKEDPALYRKHIEPLLTDATFDVRFDVPEADMPRLYAEHDVVIVPSRGYESVPTVVYEAHAAKVAVFATRDWGIKEVVTPAFGLTGDAGTDGAAIEQYLVAPRAPGQTPPSQAYRSEDFSWEAIARNFEALYTELTHADG